MGYTERHEERMYDKDEGRRRESPTVIYNDITGIFWNFKKISPRFAHGSIPVDIPSKWEKVGNCG